MKKIYTFFLVFVTAVTLGQVREDKIERLKALRIAYISEKLNLSSEEAQRFWPVFNQFDEKNLELQKQKRKLLNKLRPENASNLSEKETTDLMAEDDKIEQELQSNRQQLVKKLQGVIPNKKILMLRQIEIEFKQKLLNQMKNRKEGRFRR
jgi:hypothetical protein